MLIILFLVSFESTAQDTESPDIIDKVLSFTTKAQSTINKKIENADAAFDKTIDRQIAKLQKQERRIYQKLRRKDTAAANTYLAQSKQSITQLKDRLSNPGENIQYIAGLDSLKTSLQFLNRQNEMTGGFQAEQQRLSNSLGKIAGLEKQLYRSEELKKFLGQRKTYLKDQLLKFGLLKELREINKQTYYYTQQVSEYKEMLNNPKKIEKKLFELLSKTKVFRDFMAKNSMLAGLFPAFGGNTTDPVAFQNAMPGLQTREQITGLIQGRIAAGGPDARTAFQQNLQDAQAQVMQLKNKLIQAGKGSSDAEMPEGFKPNNQKTKTFLQRLEYGANVQTQKATSYFPVTSDIALSVGYKLNDKSIIGIGASFKLGFGRSWDHIKFTSQGIGLRSFVDWKLKGSFYISGGYEQNYRNTINNLSQLQSHSGWQQSGLIGISKSIPLKTKFFKKTSAKLLWDFLSYRQVPRAQPVVFRIGYSF